MIAYFPAPYPDELIYSQLARYYTKSGYMAYTYAAEELYVSKIVRPDMEFVNMFTPDALRMITRDMTMENVVMHHTMFPYYGRFLPLERRQRAFQALVSMEGNYHNLLPIPTRKGNSDRYLRYCPMCADHDRSEYGETYWHRTHQMIGLNVCPVHGCYLMNSSVIISGRMPPMLRSAEEAIPVSEVVTVAHEVERRLAVYMGNVKLGGDFFHIVSHQLLHLKRPCDADILGIHKGADSLVLHLGDDLLIRRASLERLIASLNQAVPADDGRLAVIFMRALRAGNGSRALNPCLAFARNHATDAGITAGMQIVQVRPLILSKGAVRGLEEIDRHHLGPVEIQSPAIVPCDSKTVQIGLVLNLQWAVVQNLAVRPDSSVVSEFGFRRCLDFLCHLGWLSFPFVTERSSAQWL